MARRLKTKPTKTKPTKQNKLKTKRTRKNKVGGKPFDIDYVYGPVDNANEQMVINNQPISLEDALYHQDFNLRLAAFEKILKPLPPQPEDDLNTRRYGYTKDLIATVVQLGFLDGFQPIRELVYAYYGISKDDKSLNEKRSAGNRKSIINDCTLNPGYHNSAATTPRECMEDQGATPEVSKNVWGKYDVSYKKDKDKKLIYFGTYDGIPVYL